VPDRYHSNTKSPQRKLASRWYKLYRIGQAHLAPGMNLARWQAILDHHGIINPDVVDDRVLDAIIGDIVAVVRGAGDNQIGYPNRGPQGS
jgi:hypothetical protein